MNEVAVFGGGCFWCTEAVFTMLKGVSLVKPGYAGGPSTGSTGSTSSPQASSGQAPTYEQVCSGRTGHAEVVYIEYDPSAVSYRTLLTIFFASHDATKVNRQGSDVGTQYRSILFYTTEKQKEEAIAFITDLNASSDEGAPVVTEIKPLTKFFDAEDYHKNYYENNKNQGYCQVIITPKLQKVQKKFAALLKENNG